MMFDDLEDEILFTVAALGADPDAADLQPHASAWLGWVDATRLADREFRSRAMSVSARRTVANTRLDDACVRFGDELYLAVARQRDSRSWKRFFQGQTARVFVRRALADQVATVAGWLSEAQEPVLDRWREPLSRWHGAAAQAVADTKGLTTARGENWLDREDLAERLTRARDALAAMLDERARERGLPRDWSAAFFRRTPPRGDAGDEAGEPEQT